MSLVRLRSHRKEKDPVICCHKKLPDIQFFYPKAFSHNYSLSGLKHIHLKEKPYDQDIYGKIYSQSNQFSQYKWLHKRDKQNYNSNNQKLYTKIVLAHIAK